MTRMRLFLQLLGTCTLFAAPIAAANPAPRAPGAPSRPKLIVVLSIDQFSSELYRRYRPTFTGGLKTLSGGTAYPIGYQSHAATETCPGHSTILTGDHPSKTGIIANSWFDVKTGSSIYCVSVAGVADPVARGPQNLRVDTLGDWMKKADPKSRSFAVSGKDRAAIMMGGHHADGIYWWVDGEGFRTSSHAGPADASVTAPAAAFNAAEAQRWKAMPPELWPAATPSCAALARPHTFGKVTVSGEVPPEAAKHVEDDKDFARSTDFQDQLRASPAYDQLSLKFAQKLIDERHLGTGPGIDLLAISLSATDYVGHRYGNGGAEMCMQMAALDRALGAFVDRLEKSGVPIVVALTADHGSTDAAEREDEHDPSAQRIDNTAFVTALNNALMKELAIGFEPIVGDDPQQLSINVGTDTALYDKVRDAALTWLRKQPQVTAVFSRADIEAATVAPQTPPTKLTVAQRFRESYDRERSGDIAVQYASRATFGVPRGPTDTVAGHGSPWDYDRQVPILFWWPGAVPQDRDAPIETVDIAPTLANLAQVPVPAVDGTCLDLGIACAP